jgi:hypothetical protein
MATTLPPIPKTIVLDGSSGPAERAFIDLYRCRRCNHDWTDHGKTGAIPPSKSRCQLAGCSCARFAQDGDL